MITQNLHMHSTWDDGKCSVEAMILASRAAGLSSVGFSVHGPMPFENSWECPKERLPDYIAEVRALKAKYAGMIDVYCGIEWDVTADGFDLSAFDYVIGSVHEIPVSGGTRSVDANPETTERYIRECFGGDADAGEISRKTVVVVGRMHRRRHTFGGDCSGSLALRRSLVYGYCGRGAAVGSTSHAVSLRDGTAPGSFCEEIKKRSEHQLFGAFLSIRHK